MYLEIAQINNALATEISGLAKLEADERPVEVAMEKFSTSLGEIENSRIMMMHQIQETFMNPLENILKKDLVELREVKRSFEKASENVDSLLDRYLSKRSKDLNVQETANEVALARAEFHERSVKYAKELNDFLYIKRTVVLEHVLALVYTKFSFYHQGYDALKDLEVYMRNLSESIKQIKVKGDEARMQIERDQKEIFKVSITSYNPVPVDTAGSAIGGSTVKAGYLMKKGSGKITQVWSRRWFAVKGSFMFYSTRGKDEQPTIAANLRLCTVKPYFGDSSADRRFCFELVSPVKSYVLQAENEREMNEWIEVIQNAIGKALNTDISHDTLAKEMIAVKGKFKEDFVDDDAEEESPNVDALAKLRCISGNELCADCATENPEWASVNLGILLCIQCSGIHRSLGVQVSKVRSLTLDRLEPELYDIMAALGNEKVNSLYEAGYKENPEIKRANPKSDRTERQKWILAKYVYKAFLVAPEVQDKNTEFVSMKLYESIVANDIMNSMKYLVLGANIDWKNPTDAGKTALLRTIEQKQPLMSLFLLNSNAELTLTDDKGWNALHYAVNDGNVQLVRALLKRNMKVDIASADGKSPIDLAVAKADPDIVTILRMHQLNISESPLMPRKSIEPHSDAAAPNKALPDKPKADTAGSDELNAAKQALKSSSNKVKQFFATSTSPTSLNASRSESPTYKSKDSTKTAIASSLSSASSMANSAVKSAGQMLKSGFAKLHHENAPTGQTPPPPPPDVITSPENKQAEQTDDEFEGNGKVSYFGGFRSPYSTLQNDGEDEDDKKH